MRIILLFVILLPFFSEAQVMKLLTTREVSDTILYMAIDRPGDIYVITKTGQFQKFDKDGHLIVLYKHHTPPTLFDPHDGSRIFAYFRDRQEYMFMNSSLNISSGVRVDSSFVIQPWLICPSGDTRLWVLDAADHSLKKLNANNSVLEVEVEIDLALIKDVRTLSAMRDYQGFVFLLKRGEGIHVFNRLGKYIRTIAGPNITSFNFLGEELYYVEGTTLKFFDLFTGETRELALRDKMKDVIVGEDRLFSLNPTSVSIYEFKP